MRYPAGGVQSSLVVLNATDAAAPQAVVDTTLTITAAYKQDFLAEAVRRYTFNHPNVEIVWDLLYPSYEAFLSSSQDAGQRMAAKIMTNDVGDIVATGGMGIEYYSALQTDAFVDLLPYLSGDDLTGSLNGAALESLTLGGALKGLPVGMAYPCLVFNRGLAERLSLTLPDSLTWSDVLALGIAHPDIPLFGMSGDAQDNLVSILEAFLNAQMPDLIQLEAKQADLRQDWFIALLEDLKTVYQAGNLFTTCDLFRRIYRTHLFEITSLRGSYDHQQLYVQNADGEIEYRPLPAGEIHRNAIAYPLCMYSISSNTEKPDAAWAFLRTLLTPDIQGLYALQAIPWSLAG